jgi:hypothetical protein
VGFGGDVAACWMDLGVSLVWGSFGCLLLAAPAIGIRTADRLFGVGGGGGVGAPAAAGGGGAEREDLERRWWCAFGMEVVGRSAPERAPPPPEKKGIAAGERRDWNEGARVRGMRLPLIRIENDWSRPFA